MGAAEGSVTSLSGCLERSSRSIPGCSPQDPSRLRPGASRWHPRATEVTSLSLELGCDCQSAGWLPVGKHESCILSLPCHSVAVGLMFPCPLAHGPSQEDARGWRGLLSPFLCCTAGDDKRRGCCWWGVLQEGLRGLFECFSSCVSSWSHITAALQGDGTAHQTELLEGWQGRGSAKPDGSCLDQWLFPWPSLMALEAN